MSRRENFEKLPPEKEQLILQMMSTAPFPKFLGLHFEEVRLDYGRLTLPYRPEFNQPASGKTLAYGNMAYRIVP